MTSRTGTFRAVMSLFVAALLFPPAGCQPTVPDVDELLAQLETGDCFAQSKALERLAEAGPQNEHVADQVAAIIADSSQPGWLRAKAVKTLVAIAADSPKTVDLLADVVQGEYASLPDGYDSPDVVRQAAKALGQLAPHDDLTSSLLLDLLSDTNAPEEIRMGAAEGIAGVGMPQASPAIAHLKRMVMEGESTEAKTTAARALVKLGETDEIVAWALAELADGDLITAPAVLGAVGPAASETVPALLNVLRTVPASSTYNTLLALGNILAGSDDQEAISAILDVLQDDNDGVRGNAASALGRIGPAAREAAPMLRQMLDDDPSGDVRVCVHRAFQQITGEELPEPVTVRDDLPPGSPIRLVAEIALRLPHPWYVAEVQTGEITPAFWAAGSGTQITLHKAPPTVGEFLDGDYEVLTLTLMEGDYDAAGPRTTSGRAPAELLQQWQGRKAIVWSNTHSAWAGHDVDIRQALTEAMNAAASGPLVGSAQHDIAIGPVTFQDIHMNIDGPEHGFHRSGAVTDRRTGRPESFYLHYLHPLYSHLAQGQEVLAVRTNRWVAIVPLESFDASESP